MKVSHRITRLVTTGLIAGALAAPAASERRQGLRLASAAIGASAAGGLILLIGVGGTTHRHRHEHIGVAH